MCEAYKQVSLERLIPWCPLTLAGNQGMTQRNGFVWFLPGWFRADWYDVDELRYGRDGENFPTSLTESPSSRY